MFSHVRALTHFYNSPNLLQFLAQRSYSYPLTDVSLSGHKQYYGVATVNQGNMDTLGLPPHRSSSRSKPTSGSVNDSCCTSTAIRSELS